MKIEVNAVQTVEGGPVHVNILKDGAIATIATLHNIDLDTFEDRMLTRVENALMMDEDELR